MDRVQVRSLVAPRRRTPLLPRRHQRKSHVRWSRFFSCAHLYEPRDQVSITKFQQLWRGKICAAQSRHLAIMSSRCTASTARALLFLRRSRQSRGIAPSFPPSRYRIGDRNETSGIFKTVFGGSCRRGVVITAARAGAAEGDPHWHAEGRLFPGGSSKAHDRRHVEAVRHRCAMGRQQAEADRFARLGLIPRPVKVADIVWKWTPAS